jgi:hypothetical protein
LDEIKMIFNEDYFQLPQRPSHARSGVQGKLKMAQPESRQAIKRLSGLCAPNIDLPLKYIGISACCIEKGCPGSIPATIISDCHVHFFGLVSKTMMQY